MCHSSCGTSILEALMMEGGLGTMTAHTGEANKAPPLLVRVKNPVWTVTDSSYPLHPTPTAVLQRTSSTEQNSCSECIMETARYNQRVCVSTASDSSSELWTHCTIIHTLPGLKYGEEEQVEDWGLAESLLAFTLVLTFAANPKLWYYCRKRGEFSRSDAEVACAAEKWQLSMQILRKVENSTQKVR